MTVMDALRGRRFYKMTGSGNDFVFFDARGGWDPVLEDPLSVVRVCARGTGIGADGVVVLGPPSAGRESGARVAIRYYNADGTRASLCGNATLCTMALLARLGGGGPGGEVLVETDSGVVAGRGVDGRYEFDLPPVTGVVGDVGSDSARPRGVERRIGFCVAGVPHAVVLVGDAAAADVARRGRELRYAAAFGASGANVNFVSPALLSGPGRPGWLLRTYERGVEGETLACGTGAVAAAVLLAEWELASGGESVLETRSGGRLGVRVWSDVAGGRRAALSGEGRLVFEGEVESL